MRPGAPNGARRGAESDWGDMGDFPRPLRHEMATVDGWLSFIALGDDFLAAYVQMSPRLGGVAAFLVGHATELYLKGVLLKHGLPLCKLKTHDLKSLLTSCRESAPGFPVALEFRDAVLDALRNTHGAGMSRCLGPGDAEHFHKYHDLYYAAYAQGDLKYVGASSRLDLLYVSWPLSGVTLMLEIFDPIRRYLGMADDIGTTIRLCLHPPFGEAAPIKLLAEYDVRKKAQQTACP